MINWRLHIIMGERRLKIADVARGTGLTWETVADIYHGRSKMVHLDTVDRLCNTLDIEPGELFAWKKDTSDRPDGVKNG